MNAHPVRFSFIRLLVQGLLAFILLNACSFTLFDSIDIFPPTATPSYPLPPASTPLPVALVTFEAALPAPLAAGETLYLSLVDEVTGLALNPANHAMTGRDALHYTISLPLPMYSVVKYRYLRQSGGLPALEDDSSGNPVRYRMFHVTGQGGTSDMVASWSDGPFSGQTGRLAGVVTDSSGGTPLVNILVTAGGIQVLTDSTGSFALEGLPAGTHTLTAYALDGAYRTYQQGAEVAAGHKTPVDISLQPAPLVQVTFTLVVPHGTIPSVPIRMAGSLLQLGNTFGDLRGGVSTVASRMPELQPLADGRYSLSLDLPAGADLRYKYTLGDGFWNAEHASDGAFVVRQLIVPEAGGQVQDQVATWQAGPSSPILFEVTVPANTPLGETVSLQINPYGWTEPAPMWAMGNSRWAYTLYSPLNMIGSFEYRYCRNEQCGSADDLQTADGRRGRPAATSLTPQNLQDTVGAWKWLPEATPGQVLGVLVQPRTSAFVAGIEFQPGYHPTWQAHLPEALQNVQAVWANWVVLSPTWTVSRTSPLVFNVSPGRDPLWLDTVETISAARALDLDVALFPAPQFPTDAAAWWQSAPRSDPAWWDAWFDRYRAFALYHADLAARNGGGMLALGGDWIGPALPGGKLSDGSASGVPADAEARWRALLADVRAHFSGPVYWALAYPGGLEEAPNFLSDLDGIYLLWQAPLGSAASPTLEEMQAEAGRLLDGEVSAFRQALNKPLVLAVAYPSVSGTAAGCLPDGSGGCLHWMELSRPNADNPAFTVDLKTQLDIYQALLGAVNTRSWVGGFVSRGYYPAAVAQDQSASVRAKPAADALWYWFPRLTGLIQ